VTRYSANAIISFINNPKNGLVISGGAPQCPKGKGCLDTAGNCQYVSGCRQVLYFYSEAPYRSYSLRFTYPLYRQVSNVGDGYIDSKNGSLSGLVHNGVISQTALIPV